jgi:hypothetical protein
MYGYRDRIEQQNARLREDTVQRDAQVALQNQRLMQEIEPPPRSGWQPSGVPLRPADDAYDGDELRLCQMLERKVAEKDYDIAEINLLVAKGLTLSLLLSADGFICASPAHTESERN